MLQKYRDKTKSLMNNLEKVIRKIGEYPNVIFWGLVFFGIVIRVMQYIKCRSLRIDEANLALNIINSSMAGLLDSFVDFQIAPFLFLILQKCNIILFGTSEYALRLLPFMFSILGVLLFANLASKVLKKNLPVFGAVLLFAVSKYLIIYCADMKQYSSNVTIAIILYLLFLKYCNQGGLSFTQQIIFGVIGALSIWMSFFSVFILASLGLCLCFCYYSTQKRNIFTLVLPCIFWGIALLGMFYFLKSNSNVELQQDLPVWRRAYMPLPPSITWLYKTFERLFLNPGGFSSSVPIIVVTFIFGCVRLLRTNKRLFYAFVLPVFMALIASALKKYPFEGRMLISMLPFMLLAIAAGSYCIAKKLLQSSRSIAVVFVLLIYFFPAVYGVNRIKDPLNFHDIKPLMNILSQNIQQGDIIYVYNGDIAAFRYYKDRYDLTDVDWIEGIHSTGGPYGTLFKYFEVTDKIDTLRNHPRVWFLFCNNRIGKAAFNEMKFHLYYLDTVGHLEAQYRSKDGFLYLYDLTKEADRRGITK